MPSMDAMMSDARKGLAEKYARQERERLEAVREGRAQGMASHWQVIMIGESPIDPDGPAGSLAIPWSELPEPVVALLGTLSWPAAPGDYRCWRCGAPVGLVRVDAEDLGAGNRWEPVGIVRRTYPALHPTETAPTFGPPSAQCARCCPDSVSSPWPADVDGAWWGDLSECSTSPDGSRVVHVTAPGASTCRCAGSQPRMAPQVAGSAGPTTWPQK